MMTRQLKQGIKQVHGGQITPILEAREEDLTELQIMLNDETFRSEQRQIKGSISMGYDLLEAKYSIGITAAKRWKFHVMALSLANYTPENLMLNYRQRSRTRYSQIMDLMKRCQPDPKTGRGGDKKVEAQCLLMLCKLDASESQLAQALGLVKLTTIEGENGVTGNDPTEYENKIRELERSINRNIDELRLALPPISIDIQYEPETGGPSDRVDEATVSEDSSQRSITTD
jgi:hypothetical protein